MQFITDYPFFVFVFSFAVMSLATLGFHFIFKRIPALNQKLHDTFTLIQGATITLVIFLIGFSFSIATGNYNSRQKYERNEAAAINTANLWCDFLPESDRIEAKQKLQQHLNLRIKYHDLKNLGEKEKINNQISEIDQDLWVLVKGAVSQQPTPIMASAASGISEVINAASYMHISQQERIPAAIWILIFVISLFCCALNSYGSLHNNSGISLTLIFPLVLAFSLMLLSDIDSTQSGFIYIDTAYIHNLPSFLSMPLSE